MIFWHAEQEKIHPNLQEVGKQQGQVLKDSLVTGGSD
jgi:hypothetical protein